MTQITLSPTPVASFPADGLNHKFMISARIDFSKIAPVSGNSYIFAAVPANTIIERTSYVVRTQGSTTNSFSIGTDGDSGTNNLLGDTAQSLNGAAGALVSSATRVQCYAADNLAFLTVKTEATAVIDIYVEGTKLPAVKEASLDT